MRYQGLGQYYCNEGDKKGALHDSTHFVAIVLRDEEDWRAQSPGPRVFKQIYSWVDAKHFVYYLANNDAENSDEEFIKDHDATKNKLYFPIQPAPGIILEESVARLSNGIRCAHPKKPPPNEENLKSVQEESLNNGVEELTLEDIDTCSLKGPTGGYVNDVILNFLLKWMSRHETRKESEFLCINSLRVDKIMKGDQCASSSKSMKSLRIFKQKVLVLPYNESKYWSVIFFCSQIA
jgi:hypothetical protein